MSTTGHYTRYINEYNARDNNPDRYLWTDNCDTMRGGHIDYTIGNFQVEHTRGNKRAYCWFDNHFTKSEKYGYRIRDLLIEHEGKKAIQYILDNLEKLYPESKIIDLIFDHINFYKFAYLDYINRIETIKPDEETQSTLNLNDWLDCDICHCVQSEMPHTCRNMTETKRAMFESGHPVCKYFQAFIGSVGVIA